MKGKKKDRRFGDHFVDHYGCSLSYRRKKRRRIRYLNWVTELYGCRDGQIESNILQDLPEHQEDDLINRQVRKAVKKLSPEEQQFIRLFYFEFKSYQQIGQMTGRRIHKLERAHQRALEKLRIILADFVRERFGLEIGDETDCVICQSPFRRELDGLIRDKGEDETYSRLIRVFKQRYGIVIKTPQVIIGHRRKHMV